MRVVIYASPAELQAIRDNYTTDTVENHIGRAVKSALVAITALDDVEVQSVVIQNRGA